MLAFLRRFMPVLAVLPCLMAAGACDPVPEEERAARPPAGSIAAGFQLSASGEVRDTGDFVVRYGETGDDEDVELEKIFRESQLLEATLEELNGEFALPKDVPVVLRECQEVNAFYDPESGEISLCYELVEHYFQIFMEDVPEEEQEEAATSAINATIFMLYHEIGHSLIDIYDLPVTGREEDAVDQLATLVLLEGGEDGENAALDGANSFVGEEQEMDELAFWDEHSLDEQRFYNIVCWSYGKNPEGLQHLLEDETLPEGRAEGCPAEYDRMSRSWVALLDPYVKE